MTHNYGKHNNIPPNAYLEAEGIGQYINLGLLENFHTSGEVEQFLNWMDGQTASLVDGEPAIYIEDYERWLRGLPVID